MTIVLRMPPGQIAAAAIDKIKLTAQRFPGEHALTLFIGPTELTLGSQWRYDGSAACLVALREFGTPEVVGC